MTEPSDNLKKAAELVNQIKDVRLKYHTVSIMELLARGDLQRDFQRAEMAANAMMHEFHKEVSEGVLNAVAINLTLGAFSTQQEELPQAYQRLFDMLQNDRDVFALGLHLASYCEVLAPALKREAENLHTAQGSTDPTPTPKNRS